MNRRHRKRKCFQAAFLAGKVQFINKALCKLLIANSQTQHRLPSVMACKMNGCILQAILSARLVLGLSVSLLQPVFNKI